jgi:hypothetical protein
MPSGGVLLGAILMLGSGIIHDFCNRKEWYGSDWRDIGKEKRRCVEFFLNLVLLSKLTSSSSWV